VRSIDNIKIGISGIRGVIGETLNPENIINFVRAFSTLVRKGQVAVATDSRISGEFIRNAVFSGLIYSGITPVDAGTQPTPTLQVFVKEKRLNGGIIVTASHNPQQWNGLKFIDEAGLFISPYKASHLIDIYHQRSFITPEENIFPDVVPAEDAFAIHKRKILALVDTEKIREKRFRVLVDPGAGAGALYDKEFLESLGCDVDVINGVIGNGFPRNPEPLPENLGQASERMKEGGFDIGFAQDADADRLALLDENGRPLDSEYTLAISLSGYLKRVKPGKVVLNLSTSRISEYAADHNGCRVVWSPVGETNVVKTMMEVGAVAGGEGNGGVIVPAVHHCRDSFTAMALVLDTLAQSGRKVSEIVKTLPALKMVKIKLPLSMTAANRVVRLLAEEYPEGNTVDGLKVEKEDYWFHIRASNTEPIIRIVAEGREGEIEDVVEGLKSRIIEMTRR